MEEEVDGEDDPGRGRIGDRGEDFLCGGRDDCVLRDEAGGEAILLLLLFYCFVLPLLLLAL